MVLRTAWFIALAALAALAAACGSPPPATTAAAAAPRSSQSTTPVLPAGANTIETGQWRTVATYANVTGLPPALARSMMARPHPFEGCAASSDINAMVQDAISGDGQMTCADLHASAANGVLGGAATCHDRDGDSGRLSFSGTFTSTHVDVNGELSAQTQMGPMSEQVHWVSDHSSATCASR